MFFAAVAMTFSSCDKNVETTDPIEQEPAVATKTLIVKSAIAETRTSLGEDHQIQWEKGDQYRIIFADESFNILGNTLSPEYDPEVTEFELSDVPENTKYLCCSYPDLYPFPHQMPSDLTNATIDMYRGGSEAYGFSSSNIMLSTAEVADDNSVTVMFTPVVTILEINLYDTEGRGYYAQNVTISSSDGYLAGEPTYDFTSNNLTLTDYSDTQSVGGYQLLENSKDNCFTLYTPIAKKSYTDLKFDVTVLDSDWDDHYFSFTFNSVDMSDMKGCTVNLDLGKFKDEEKPAGSVFAGPTADDDGGEVEWNVYSSSFDYGYDEEYPSVQQYGLNMRNTKSVTFESAPENVTIKAYYFEDGYDSPSETDAVFTLVDNKLTVDSESGSYDFRLYFYENGDETTPVAIIALTYFMAQTTGGDEEDDGAILKLDSDSAGQELRVSTDDDSWYKGDTEEYTLTANSQFVWFSKFPEYDSYTLSDNTSGLSYFSISDNYDTKQIDIFGTAAANENSITEAEYTVNFTKGSSVVLRLHIIYKDTTQVEQPEEY